MNRLKELGFIKAGNWRLKDDGEIWFELIVNGNINNVVYCFVSERKIKYVGKTLSLIARLENYKKPVANHNTDMQIHERIIDRLNKSKTVSIWILPDTGELKYRYLTLNLADALEMALIKDIKYKIWNKAGRYEISSLI